LNLVEGWGRHVTRTGSDNQADNADADHAQRRGRPARVARYRSPLREQRAAQTRRRITDSARELFVAHGFAGTTIAAIAHRAGVAPQTVYATFSSKAAVLQALLTGLEEAAGAVEWRNVLAAEREPERLLAAFAQWTAGMFGTSRQLIAAAGAAAADPALSEFAAQGGERRRMALRSLIARIAAAGALRHDLTQSQALDRAWLVTGADLFLAASGPCGWSEQECARWLTELLRQQILQPSN
jgi:AcrR family transcriptional regulator